jgi:hypothetical protein
MAGNYKSIPKLFAKKFAVTWNLFNDFNKYNIWYGIVFSFALIGFYLFFSRKSDHGIGSCLLVTVFLYFSFIAVIFVGEPRYRYPAEPFLIIFAGYGVVTAGRLLRSKVLFSALICLILAVNALLYACSDKVLGLVRLLSRQSGLSW